jgi:SAM-dependent methyltransferase
MLRKRQNLDGEAPPSVWNRLYGNDDLPWQSGGLTETTRRLLSQYARGDRLLEIGCGTGTDSAEFIQYGFDYLGLDISVEAINVAVSRCNLDSARFRRGDFLKWSTNSSFDVVYDKGLFHGLAGVRRRTAIIRRIASVLKPGGLWITVCGSADRRRSDFSHGAIYLRDLIAPAEIYFEVLEIVKATYGLANPEHDFEAWHAALRCR